MKQYLIVSATGKDRLGFVNSITHAIHEAKGNIELQRSMRMAGEYAILILFSIDNAESDAAAVLTHINALDLQDANISAREAVVSAETDQQADRGTLEASGADQPGVIEAVTLTLFKNGVNIEEMNYDTESAPMTGETLFRMEATLAIPGNANVDAIRAALNEVADEYNFDVRLNQSDG